MERPWIGTEFSLGNSFMGCHLSTYQVRGTGDLTRTQYEYGSTDEEGDLDYGPSG